MLMNQANQTTVQYGSCRSPLPRARWSYFGLAVLLVALSRTVAAVGPKNALNDTGVTTYGNATSSGLTSEPADFPGQDARFGRDAAAAAGRLPKVGTGSKGFDFTKIANNGAVLPSTAVFGPGPNDWACTYDNVTGLMWEVKVDDANHLRYAHWIYTWYDTNPSTNGGNAGRALGGTCWTAGRCDTEKFVEDVNNAGLCGRSDWRMPTKRELLSIVDFGRWPGSIDTIHFPNTAPGEYWSASAANLQNAWLVGFSVGNYYAFNKEGGMRVRLVRAGQ